MPGCGLHPATIGTELDGRERKNSFTFLRLTFALAVMVSHSWPAGGFGDRMEFGRYEPGALAVDGFFVVSGFLITRSRLRLRSTARFLWHRFLRIFPAFWVCLVVVAALIAPLAWLHDHGTLAGYLRARPHGPVQFIVSNSALKMRFNDIAGTPTAVPLGPPNTIFWAGPLWTLWWEFICYIGIAALGALGIIQKRRAAVAAFAVVLWSGLALRQLLPGLAGGLLDTGLAGSALRFGPLFLSGALLYLYADRVPLSGRLAVFCALVLAAGAFMPEPHLVIDLPLAYLCLWLALRLPFHRVGSVRDLSYGFYIYALPVQQLMAVYGMHRLGFVPYLALCLVGATAFAAASWHFIERPALRLKDAQPRWIPPARPGRPYGRAGPGRPAAGVPAPRRPHAPARARGEDRPGST